MNKKTKPVKRRLRGLKIFAAIIALILIAVTFYFENIKGSYEEKIENIRGSYLSLSKNAGLIDETKKQRVDFYKRRYFLDFPLKYSYFAANFVRELDLIAADTIELLEIEINPVNQGLTFSLKGRTRGPEGDESQSRFLDFYRALGKLDNMVNLESSRDGVFPDKKGPGAAKKGIPVVSRGKIEQGNRFFTIAGELETW